MNNTCSDQCAWYKKFKSGVRCPFYLETLWKADDGTAKVVSDCAPKRSVMLQMEAHNQMIGLQKAHEQQRNKVTTLLDVVATATHQTKYIDADVEDVKQLE